MRMLDDRLHEVEKLAMLQDRDAILRIVSLLRVYREESAKLLDKRYRDGEVDAVALGQFQDALNNAEEDHLLDGERARYE